MQRVLLSTAYLAPVRYYSILSRFGDVTVEKYCHYTKQTYRNRCLIATANGVQALSIPIEKPETLKCMTKDIRIASHGNWQHLHWNAIVSAYQSSPFFEYYEDDFRPFYEKKFDFLFDFNEELRLLLCRSLDLETAVRYSSDYETDFQGYDLREAIHPKKEYAGNVPAITLKPYYQVFGQRYGFQENLSVIDLLFNMGPESLLILQ